MVVTALLFPLQYLSLEIPKRIINGAIGSPTPTVDVLGVEMAQVTLLALLCVALLATVIGQGLLKMRLNTMKGMLAERMLQRFRFMLTSRLFRFPGRYFRRTSQGELVSMVTSESEALGGMMGDAISQPLFQGGQMITILAFLMIQSPWLGLAAAALIPLQAWLIPRMQRQINLLARERVKEVRKFATVIGESADGAVHFRRTGGLAYWKAVISHRLSRLAAIRFEIYKKKFFMKFVNNFITQLTPLMFFAFGGYLVIQGDLTVGALVAALAAHKDLAAPWKELLTYYNQVQETAIRYTTVTERFAPEAMIDEGLVEATAEPGQGLAGDLALENVTVLGEDGAARLKDISLSVPQGAMVGIAVDSEETRSVLADLLTRELLPSDGTVRAAGQDLATLPQALLSARIGYAGPRVFVHQGTFGRNTQMPIMTGGGDVPMPGSPGPFGKDVPELKAEDWVVPGAAGQTDGETLQSWWIDLVMAMDASGDLLGVALARRFDDAAHPGLEAKLLDLRAGIRDTLESADLKDACARFDRGAFSDGLPIAANLFFAIPRRPVTKAELSGVPQMRPLLQKLGLEADLLALTRDVIDLLQRIFGIDGVKHPLFRRTGLDAETYGRCVDLLPRIDPENPGGLSDDEMAQLLVIPFNVSADQIGVAFPGEMKARIVGLRPEAGALLENGLGDLFAPLDPERFTSGLNLLENLIFGKLAGGAGPKAGRVRELVAEALRASGRARDVYELLFDLETEIGGANLTATLTETLELTRAALKRPDLLILDHALASLSPAHRRTALDGLRALLPETTFIHLEAKIEDRDAYDACHEIRHGQLVREGTEASEGDDRANPASVDLSRKIALIEACELFKDLDRKQLQLLAFGSRWYEAEAGTVIFSLGDEPTDGAYIIAEGEAELFVPQSDGTEEFFATMKPGVLIGELALLNDQNRSLSMRAKGDLRALRIGAEEFLSVIEHDIGTAVKLLRVLSRYAAPKLR